ncbi:MAG: FAD:protein FMN transferase [Chitinophagaceae bacterium]|nr:FAD:protein FMN transferase [Chitinophagaceae bacterium]
MKVILMVAGLLLTQFFSAHCQFKKYNFQQPKMGSPFNIIMYADDSSKAAFAAEKAFKLVDTLNQVYSDYLPTSELNQLCSTAGSGKWIKASPILYDILIKAKTAGRQSKGSFDISMSPVIRIWRNARRINKLPSKDSIRLAMQKVGYRFIEIDTVKQLVRLIKPGMQLDLGGIAKGETAQRVYDRLNQMGYPYALIDAGGDIVAGSTPVGISGWKVAINLPESEELMDKQLLLAKKAVTTSGDLYQYLEVNGVRYSHIIDPATGWAVTNNRNVTVIANDGTHADWLTKACTILSIKKALKLISKYPGAEVQIAVIQNEKIHFNRSKGFVTYFNVIAK